MSSEVLKNLKAVLRPNLMRILSTDLQEYFSTLIDYIPILLENGHPRDYIESRVKEILGNDKAKEVCSWLYDWLGKNDTKATLGNNTENVEKLKLSTKPETEAKASPEKPESETKDDSQSLETEVLWPKPKKANAIQSTKSSKAKPRATRKSASASRKSTRDSSVSSIDTRAHGSRSTSYDRSVSVSTDRSMSVGRGNRRYRPYPQNSRRNNSWIRPGSLGVPSVNRPMGPLKCAVCQERFFHMPRLQDHMKTHFGGVGGDNTKQRRYREAPDAYSLWFHKA